MGIMVHNALMTLMNLHQWLRFAKTKSTLVRFAKMK